MRVNMSAGQTPMSSGCLRGLSQQMWAPIYYPWYWDLEEETLGMLQRLLPTTGDILLIAGCGTYGMEASMQSLFRAGDRVVVVMNGGVFGGVAASLLRIVGCEPLVVDVPYGRPMDVGTVEAALDVPGVRGLYAVHAETSTGTVFPIAELGWLARERDLFFMVDCISSLVGMDFQVDAWGVDLAFASLQKCISGPQGVAIVGVSPRVWAAVDARDPDENTSLCLDLTVWRRYHDVKVRGMNLAWREHAPQPHGGGRAPHETSPSGPVVQGLHGALTDLFTEGLEHARRRHEVCAAAVRAAVRAMGLRVVAASDEVAAPVVTVFHLPEGLYERDLRQRLLGRFGVAIGNGEIGDDNLRIGTMGVGAQRHFVFQGIMGLEETLASFDHPLERGAAVGAARPVFAAADDIDWTRVH